MEEYNISIMDYALKHSGECAENCLHPSDRAMWKLIHDTLWKEYRKNERRASIKRATEDDQVLKAIDYLLSLWIWDRDVPQYIYLAVEALRSLLDYEDEKLDQPLRSLADPHFLR